MSRLKPRPTKIIYEIARWLLKSLVRALLRARQNGHLVGDGEAVAFECDYFPRMIREHAQALETEVDQDLRADAAFMLQQALPCDVLVELPARVIQNMRERAGSGSSGFNSEAAPCVVQINKHSEIFRRDGFE